MNVVVDILTHITKAIASYKCAVFYIIRPNVNCQKYPTDREIVKLKSVTVKTEGA